MKHCPTDTDLKRFLAGRLEDDRIDGIGDHLSSCCECLDVLDAISSGDDSVDDAFDQGPTSEWSEKLIEESLGQMLESPPEWLTRLEVDGDDSGKSDPAAPESVGEYDLIDRIGQGGMGAVYRAHNRMSKKDVAVKVMSTARVDTPVARARFESEVQVSAELDSHPNIVATYHAGQDGEWLYLVMERISGIDAGQLMARHGPIPAADACEIAYRTALALQHAHARQLTHRDVKPSNVMIGLSGEVRVLDFGLTRAVRSVGEFPSEPNRELTSHGAVLGTPRFMAPEQFHDSRHADIRSDIFSLGLTLYYLLCADDPFRRTDTDAATAWSRTEQLSSLHVADQHEDWNSDLCVALERMLAIDPDDRFLTPQEVAEALKPLTAGQDLLRLVEPLCSADRNIPRQDELYTVDLVPRRFGAKHLAGVLLALIGVVGLASVIFRQRGSEHAVDDVGPSVAARLADASGDDPRVESDISAQSHGVAIPEIPEPEPLDEWMAGREIRTVAQDGSAQFRTITEALQDLAPGGVVEILDTGPYFERLDFEVPPEDCGIVSRCGTIIAIRRDDWEPVPFGNAGDKFRGHEFPDANGFRLSGLTLIGQYKPNATLIFTWKACGIVIDHCSLYIVDDQRGAISGTGVTLGQSEFGPTGRPNVLCDNTMNIGIGSFLSSQHSQTLICRNLQFASLGTVVANSEGACTGRHDYVVHHNVLVAGPDGGGMWQNWTWRDRDSQRFVMHNNTMFWPGSQVMFNVPEWSRFKDLVHGARLQNNIIIGQHALTFQAEAESRLDDIRDDWMIDHNAIAVLKMKYNILPPAASDLVIKPNAISTDLADSSFARIGHGSPLATSGAGHDLPEYIGAVPPGPPPDTGDWLSRARLRFQAVKKIAQETFTRPAERD